ncbi:UNVERIFIED_ORG: hypothetical protein HNP28_003750 [Comamonas terrigena]
MPDDPLVFWSQHEADPCEVNLHSFATGQDKSNHPHGGGKKFIPFTGRPGLILQLAPAIAETLSYACKGTVLASMNALRDWWRVLDAVEIAAASARQPMERVDSILSLTHVHSEFAHRSGMSRQAFGKLRSLVDLSRVALGEQPTFWKAPEDEGVEKNIPPLEQRNTLRFALRAACRSVLEKWQLSDKLCLVDLEPTDPKEASLWRNVKLMRELQKQTGKILPTPEESLHITPAWAINSAGTFKLSLRESIFPSHWDAAAVWHFCVLNTGWNPSTLTNLDVTKKFLFNHFKDSPSDPHQRFVLRPQTYQLVGEKNRSGGNEQFVVGQWKSLDGPGHLIKTYLNRVEPLRQILKQQLIQEKLKYSKIDVKEYDTRKSLFEKIKKLEKGLRSVWLYVNRRGEVSWLSEKSNRSDYINGEQVTYLQSIIHYINIKIKESNSNKIFDTYNFVHTSIISNVSAKDFRLWFADYVYRASHGNMLHVKKALNHSLLRTSIGYVNTNVLNQESFDGARRFLGILVEELNTGRIDLTILAHLYRYGDVAPEQKEILAEMRKLPRSRMNMACKSPRHPPPQMKSPEGELCDSQRCMLCPENAVLLPESIDGIAMRIEELLAIQSALPVETWLEEMYDIELKNNLVALHKFDLKQGCNARKKWAQAIASGEAYVPGIPLPPADAHL